MRYQVETGRKLNVHKTFRRRPRRLLNALCMLKLRLCLRGRFHLKVWYSTDLILYMIQLFYIFLEGKQLHYQSVNVEGEGS